MIVNVLGLSKFLYLSRVLLMPVWVLARINQLVWPFIWGSRIETMSRRSCCLPFLAGGLNLCDVRLKCESLRLASTIVTVDNPDDCSFFLCKYFIGQRLSCLQSRWAAFYESCLLTLTKVTDSELSSRKIYAKLLLLGSSSPSLPRQWAFFLGPSFSLRDHWSLVRDGFTENFKNDLLWLIALRGVKTRDALSNWGYINSAACASCPRRETIDHCFINCPRVKLAWTLFLPVLNICLGSVFSINLLFILFFRWPPCVTKQARLTRCLVKSILYGIWTFRNKATFYNSRDDHRAIVNYIKGDIRRRVRLDFFRFTESRFNSE